MRSQQFRERMREVNIGNKNHLGHKHSTECKIKIGRDQTGEKNHNWKGDNPGRQALHMWVRRWKPKPKLCTICNREKYLETANISGNYKRDIDDWVYLCVTCHHYYDSMRNFNKIFEGKNRFEFQELGWAEPEFEGRTVTCV